MENIEGTENYEEENINENTSFENDNIIFKNDGNIEEDKNSIYINSVENFLIDKGINILNPDENNENEERDKKIESEDKKIFKFNYPRIKKRKYIEIKKDLKEIHHPKNIKKFKYH